MTAALSVAALVNLIRIVAGPFARRVVAGPDLWPRKLPSREIWSMVQSRMRDALRHLEL